MQYLILQLVLIKNEKVFCKFKTYICNRILKLVSGHKNVMQHFIMCEATMSVSTKQQHTIYYCFVAT